MKKTLRSIGLGSLLMVGLSACVTSQPVSQTDFGSVSSTLKAEFTDQVTDFRDYTGKGNCQNAARIFDNLQGNYSSQDAGWEVALLTDLCLCHVEQDEVSRFTTCAAKLAEYSGDMTFIDRETQFVEQLAGYFSGYVQNNSRIDRTIHTGFVQTLGDSEE